MSSTGFAGGLASGIAVGAQIGNAYNRGIREEEAAAQDKKVSDLRLKVAEGELSRQDRAQKEIDDLNTFKKGAYDEFMVKATQGPDGPVPTSPQMQAKAMMHAEDSAIQKALQSGNAKMAAEQIKSSTALRATLFKRSAGDAMRRWDASGGTDIAPIAELYSLFPDGHEADVQGITQAKDPKTGEITFSVPLVDQASGNRVERQIRQSQVPELVRSFATIDPAELVKEREESAQREFRANTERMKAETERDRVKFAGNVALAKAGGAGGGKAGKGEPDEGDIRKADHPAMKELNNLADQEWGKPDPVTGKVPGNDVLSANRSAATSLMQYNRGIEASQAIEIIKTGKRGEAEAWTGLPIVRLPDGTSYILSKKPVKAVPKSVEKLHQFAVDKDVDRDALLQRLVERRNDPASLQQFDAEFGKGASDEILSHFGYKKGKSREEGAAPARGAGAVGIQGAAAQPGIGVEPSGAQRIPGDRR